MWKRFWAGVLAFLTWTKPDAETQQRIKNVPLSRRRAFLYAWSGCGICHWWHVCAMRKRSHCTSKPRIGEVTGTSCAAGL